MNKVIKTISLLALAIMAFNLEARLSPENTVMTIHNDSSYTINDLRVKTRMRDKEGVVAKGSAHIYDLQPGKSTSLDLLKATKKVHERSTSGEKRLTGQVINVLDFVDAEGRHFDKNNIVDVSVGKIVTKEATKDGVKFNKKGLKKAKFNFKKSPDIDPHFDVIEIKDSSDGGLELKF